MKSIFQILLLALSVQICPATESITPHLTEGLTAAIDQGSFSEALVYWYAQSEHLTENKTYNKNIRSIIKFEQRIGPPRSFEVLGVDSPIDELKVVYIALKHDKGAYFMKLIVYHDGTKWELKEYWYNTNPTEIIPDSYYHS